MAGRFRKPAHRTLFVHVAEGTSSCTSPSSTACSPRSSTARPTTSATGVTKRTRRRSTTGSQEHRNDNVVAASEYDRIVAERMSESAFQTQQVQLARTLNFQTYHTRDSRGSDRGFPDLNLLSRTRLLYLELKRQRNAHLTTDQVTWLDTAAALRDSGNPCVEVYVARPLDSRALFITLSEGVQAPGTLHQWCLRPGCARCSEERDHAVIVLPGRRRRTRR